MQYFNIYVLALRTYSNGIIFIPRLQIEKIRLRKVQWLSVLKLVKWSGIHKHT